MRVWTSAVAFMLERIPTWFSVVNCSNTIGQRVFRTLHQELDLADSGRGNTLFERVRVVWKDARGVDRPMPLLRQPSRGGDAVRRDSRYQACAALDELLPLLRSRVPETSRQAGPGTEGKVDLRESWDATSRITDRPGHGRGEHRAVPEGNPTARRRSSEAVAGDSIEDAPLPEQGVDSGTR